MQVNHVFNATEWITENMLGGTTLRAEASTAVANFTMMWNLFEGVVCDNQANVPRFERLSLRIAESQLAPVDLGSLEDCLAFWSFRYRHPNGFSSRFDGLHFRPRDRRELVVEVLLGNRTQLPDKILALMIIVYRLRNNLFHGLKTIDMLNDQIENLNTASYCLGILLRISHTHLILECPQQDQQAFLSPLSQS
jgi:hypothetical protein